MISQSRTLRCKIFDNLGAFHISVGTLWTLISFCLLKATKKIEEIIVAEMEKVSLLLWKNRLQ